MRILAIRGRNLASLAGDFEIDFQREPLASAGLFAISGATGAGKSTLLDALCLALFDDTPRLRGADARGIELPDVGRDTTLPNDRRNILRRGCAEGYAEVDFLGNDGVSYRARWSVRRARNKPDGKLQQAEMSLLRIDDQQAVCGRLKSEVQRAIIERIGLSFEQFTRAVLLAQNEFFTFLKAGEDERAALLQTLTGTDRFEQLSRRAFERNKLEQDTLRALQGRLAEQQPLDAERRQQVEHALADTRAALQQQQAREQQLDTRLRWHQDLQRAHQQVTEARTLLDEALARRDAASERQATLARVEAVQPARSLLENAERLKAERDTTAQEVDTATTSLATATQQVEAAHAALTAATSVLTALQAQRAEFDTPLAQARQLDTQIATLAPACTQAHTACQQASAARAQAERDVATHRAARNDAQIRRDAALAWLAQHPQLTALAQGWIKWDSLFTAAADEQRNLDAARIRSRELQTQSAAHAIALRDASTTLSRQATELAQHQATVNDAEVALREYDPDAIARDRSALDEQLARLQQATQRWRELVDLRAQLDELEQQCAGQRDTHTANQTRIAEIDNVLPARRAAAAQAESAWRVVFEASQASVETLREQLRPDAPCPVCGSETHPYADNNPALDNALDQLAQAREQCRSAVEALTIEREALARDSANREQLLHAATQKRTRMMEQHTQREAAWGTITAELQAPGMESPNTAHVGAASAATIPSLARLMPPLPPTTDRDAVNAWLATLGTELRKHQQQLTTRESGYRAALSALQNAQRALKDGETAHHNARETVARLQSEADRLASDLRGADTDTEQTGKRLAALLAQLDAAHGNADWREPWQAEPAAWHARCAALVAEWKQHEASATTLAADIAKLDAQADGLARVAEQARTRDEQASATWTRQRDELAAKQASRAALFAGMALPSAPDVGSTPNVNVGAALAATGTPFGAKAPPTTATAQTAEGLSVADIEAAFAQALTHARERQQDCQTALTQAQQQHTAQQSTLNELTRRAAALSDSAQRARAALDDWLAARARDGGDANALDIDALRALLDHDHAWIAAERAALQQLDNAVTSAAGGLDKLTHLRDTLEHNRPPLDAPGDDSAAACATALTEAGARVAALRDDIVGHELALRRDDEIRVHATQLVEQIDAQSRAARIWAQMNELIGAADGKKFRNYAQQLTLDVLLAYANAHLADLARRYRLERVPNSLALMVVDQDMGDEPRSVHSLSGGESFLVSLALALGLASLSSHRVRVESLFIDEGFGSLDADTLRAAMDALDSLQALGRKVGVISHVQEMTERIGTRIQVRRLPGGQSQVEVVNAGY
jgi:exonuclease SbcC